MTGGSTNVAAWQTRHAVMSRAWRVVMTAEHDRQVVQAADWASTAGRLRAEQRRLVDSGLWRGGPRTLLAAINAQYSELAMTAGLAWLLRPDGHHGLGPAVINGLVRHLGIMTPRSAAGVRVVLEEQRDRTRADLVVYGPSWTIVVEAKTFAVEQDKQLYRLHEHWAGEPDPHFVFLTRGPRSPGSAGDRNDRWRGMTWRQVAEIARSAADAAAHPTPGVFEYINTLEAYHHV